MPRAALLKPSHEQKSDSAFLTISEVAAELDIPQHVLRFWETRFPQIKPLKMRGGRRYYRPEDVVVLHRIKSLLYSQGYTIKGAKKAIHGGADLAEIVAAPVAVKTVPEIAASPSDRNGMVQIKKEELQAILSELYEMRDMLKKFAKVA